MKQYFSDSEENLLKVQIKNLSEYGHFNRNSGSFEFIKCHCGGPLLGHKIKCDENCEQLNENQIEEIQNWLESFTLFLENKDKLDDRISERICIKCNSVFENRHKNISHQRLFHKIKSYGLEEKSLPLMKNLSSFFNF